jgi:hypothetical protein
VTRTERRSDTLDMFATDSTRQPTPSDPTTAPAKETPTTEHPVIRGLPTVPSADIGGTTRRRKKSEPEPAVSQAS